MQERREIPGCPNLCSCPVPGRLHYGLVVFDCRGRIEWCDRSFLEMVEGDCDAAMVGRDLYEVITGGEMEGKTIDILVNHLLRGESAEVEMHRSSGDGEGRWFRLEVDQFGVEKEMLRYMTGFLKDVTRYKKIGEKLRKAVGEAEAANRAKSAFLANMSHELRTPLNAIIGYCDLLREARAEMTEEEIAGDLEKIGGAGRHLLQLLNEILDLARIDAGHAKLDVGKFDIAGLVLEVKDLLLKQIESGGNELTVEIDDEIGTMRCDRLRVKQCLINLMSNAAKFTRDGRIRLQVHRAANGRDWVIFQVEDTGIGMTPDQQRRVFGAFEQGDESISVQFGGIGLGLNISQKLAHAMGGDIQLESKPGAGSVFWLTLPRFCMVEDGRREEMRIDADGLLARGIKGGAQRE